MGDLIMEADEDDFGEMEEKEGASSSMEDLYLQDSEEEKDQIPEKIGGLATNSADCNVGDVEQAVGPANVVAATDSGAAGREEDAEKEEARKREDAKSAEVNQTTDAINAGDDLKEVRGGEDPEQKSRDGDKTAGDSLQVSNGAKDDKARSGGEKVFKPPFNGAGHWFMCEICQFQDMKLSAIKFHLIQEHDRSESHLISKMVRSTLGEIKKKRFLYNCKECDRKFELPDMLKSHIQKDHAAVISPAKQTQKTGNPVDSGNELFGYKILKSTKKGTTVYKCCACNFQVSQEQDIKRHGEDVHKQKCSETASLKPTLFYYELVSNGGEKHFCCCLCSHKSLTVEMMRKHGKETHNVNKTAIKQLGYKVVTKGKNYRTQYRCCTCKYMTFDEKAIRQHEENTHKKITTDIATASSKTDTVLLSQPNYPSLPNPSNNSSALEVVTLIDLSGIQSIVVAAVEDADKAVVQPLNKDLVGENPCLQDNNPASSDSNDTTNSNSTETNHVVLCSAKSTDSANATNATAEKMDQIQQDNVTTSADNDTRTKKTVINIDGVNIAIDDVEIVMIDEEEEKRDDKVESSLAVFVDVPTSSETEANETEFILPDKDPLAVEPIKLLPKVVAQGKSQQPTPNSKRDEATDVNSNSKTASVIVFRSRILEYPPLRQLVSGDPKAKHKCNFCQVEVDKTLRNIDEHSRDAHGLTILQYYNLVHDHSSFLGGCLFKCQLCSTFFSTRLSHFSSHLKSSHNIDTFVYKSKFGKLVHEHSWLSCWKCGEKVWHEENTLEKHIRLHRMTEEEFVNGFKAWLLRKGREIFTVGNVVITRVNPPKLVKQEGARKESGTTTIIDLTTEIEDTEASCPVTSSGTTASGSDTDKENVTGDKDAQSDSNTALSMDIDTVTTQTAVAPTGSGAEVPEKLVVPTEAPAGETTNDPILNGQEIPENPQLHKGNGLETIENPQLQEESAKSEIINVISRKRKPAGPRRNMGPKSKQRPVTKEIPLSSEEEEESDGGSKSDMEGCTSDSANIDSWSNRCTYCCGTCARKFRSQVLVAAHSRAAHGHKLNPVDMLRLRIETEFISCRLCNKRIVRDGKILEVHFQHMHKGLGLNEYFTRYVNGNEWDNVAAATSQIKHSENESAAKEIKSKDDFDKWSHGCVYSCKLCSLSFNSACKFKEHLVEKHRKNKQELEEETKKSRRVTMFEKCELCDEDILKEPNALRKHFVAHKTSAEKYFDKFIGLKNDNLDIFDTEDAESQHWANGCTLKCRKCPCIFATQKDAKEHCREKHKASHYAITFQTRKFFECQLCLIWVLHERSYLSAHFDQAHNISLEEYEALYLSQKKQIVTEKENCSENQQQNRVESNVDSITAGRKSVTQLETSRKKLLSKIGPKSALTRVQQRGDKDKPQPLLERSPVTRSRGQKRAT